MTEPRLRSFDLETVLRDIYAEEGNVSITSFWDCGFTVKIGDRLNGFEAECTFSREEFSFDRAAMWLARTFSDLYPLSNFARKYGSIAPYSDQGTCVSFLG